MAEAKKTPQVTVPGEEADRPPLARVGLIALVCFAIGVLWPTLAGVRLVPEPPTKTGAEDPKDKASPRPARSAEQEATLEVPAMQVGPQGLKVSPGVKVEEALVVNCRDAQDRRENKCDKPGFDGVAKDRLMALLACDAAGQPDGMLSIGFDLDFPNKKIQRILRGKSTTLDDTTADALIECARQEFMSATLEGVEHTHARYLVFYSVQFAPAGSGDAVQAAEPTVDVSGKATVIWNSALLRATPEEGEVKATLMYGAKVMVTGRQGDWYRVKYDAKGNEAWVHKNALAL